jgi:hypothetical protein
VQFVLSVPCPDGKFLSKKEQDAKAVIKFIIFIFIVICVQDSQNESYQEMLPAEQKRICLATYYL